MAVTLRDRRALLAGGTVIVVAIMALRMIPGAARSYGQMRDRTAERLATLDRARIALATRPATEDSFALAARELVALAPKLVTGDTQAEAAATLTAEVSLAADRAGLRVISLNAVPDSSTGTFVPVGLRGELEGDIRGLAAFVKRVEGGTVLLTVKSLRVLAGDPLERQPGPEQLRIELVVAGWRLNRIKA